MHLRRLAAFTSSSCRRENMALPARLRSVASDGTLPWTDGGDSSDGSLPSSESEPLPLFCGCGELGWEWHGVRLGEPMGRQKGSGRR